MKQLLLKIMVLTSLIGVFFAGCDLGRTSIPEGLITDSLLVEVLADFFIAEGAMIQLEYIHRKQPDSGAPLYKAIYEKHGINRDQVISSIDYYSQDEEKIDRIYDLVILELSRRQSAIGVEEEE